jgi:putative YhdH/YhfP family quinone oxidoreductase
VHDVQTFKAYLIEGSPASTSARFADLTEDDLDPGDVTLRVAYASINFKDALAATGKGRIIRRFPCVGGIDAVGTVENSADPRFVPGDTVIAQSHGFGVSQHGGYAQRARVPADWVTRVPDGLSALQAITVGVAGYTAALAIDLCELNGLAPERGKVLVNGATGGLAASRSTCWRNAASRWSPRRANLPKRTICAASGLRRLSTRPALAQAISRSNRCAGRGPSTRSAVSHSPC